jgi:hypothetical protein
MGCPSALASPVARVGFAPLPDTLDMGRAAEIIPVVRFVEPTALAGGLAGLAARGRGAVALAPGTARVGRKEGLTVLALAFGKWTSHWPASPQANDRKIGAWKEENGEEKSEED